MASTETFAGFCASTHTIVCWHSLQETDACPACLDRSSQFLSLLPRYTPLLLSFPGRNFAALSSSKFRILPEGPFPPRKSHSPTKIPPRVFRKPVTLGEKSISQRCLPATTLLKSLQKVSPHKRNGSPSPSARIPRSASSSLPNRCVSPSKSAIAALRSPAIRSILPAAPCKPSSPPTTSTKFHSPPAASPIFL